MTSLTLTAVFLCVFTGFTRGLPLVLRDNSTSDYGCQIAEAVANEKLNDIGDDSSIKRVKSRSVVSDKSEIWTDGVVPYYIDETFFEDEEMEKIRDAFREFHKRTCIRFIPRTTEMPYLLITPMSRCASEIGMPKQANLIRSLSLGPACTENKGTIIHELMHILGFWHEQNRPDRDNYITINWENIRDGMEHNFFKYPSDKVDTLNEPYDYRSIMHYNAFAFAADPRKPTIVPNIPIEIGQRLQLSSLDIKKLHKLYGCTSAFRVNIPTRRTTTTTTSQPDGAFNRKPFHHQQSGGGGIVFPPAEGFIQFPVNFDRQTTTDDPDRIVFLD